MYIIYYMLNIFIFDLDRQWDLSWHVFVKCICLDSGFLGT